MNKFVCPRCGGAFGPPDFVTNRELSRFSPKELPSGNMHTWALPYLDLTTGEQLLDAEKTQFGTFSLILTDRRLIYLGGGGGSAHELVVADHWYLTWPLHTIVSVEAKQVFSGGTTMTIKTRTGESQTWKKEIPFENFAQHTQAAIQKAMLPLVFPAGEEVFFDGVDDFNFLNLGNQSSPFVGSELIAKRFLNSHRISLAITNRRLLFYRINHIQNMTGHFGTVEIQMGAPILQFISLPWEAIQRISVARSLLGGGVDLVLDQPVWAWMTQGLKVYPPESITCQEIERPCKKCGKTIVGGVGEIRQDSRGQNIDGTVSGSYCPQCNTATHKACMKFGESPTSKCPTCQQPRQLIDRGYAQLHLQDEAQREVSYLTQQANVPPIGKSGEEWKLTLTKNLKLWETQLRPAVAKANPQVKIEG